MSLRKKVIRLAYENPSLRNDLLPVLEETAKHEVQASMPKQASSGEHILKYLARALQSGDTKLKFEGKMRLYVPKGSSAGPGSTIFLVEVPTKPLKRKKMEVAALFPNPAFGGFSEFIAENLLQDAKIAKSDTFEGALQKLKKALIEAEKAVDEKGKANGKLDMSSTYPRLEVGEVNYLLIPPSDSDPFTVKGKDFTMKVSWGNFEVYSPNSDLANHDPSYTKYEAKSPTAARKVFKILKVDPDQLKTVAWNDLSKWFDGHKVPYKTLFSSWH